MQRAGSDVKGVKFLAALLVLGGVFGAGLVVFFVLTGQIGLLQLSPVLALFGFAAFAGVRLWQGHARGWRWGLILYAMQIPILSTSGLVYEFYVGPAIEVLAGSVDPHFKLEFGANAQFYLGATGASSYSGLNLFALAAFCYLFSKRPRPSADPNALGTAGTAASR